MVHLRRFEKHSIKPFVTRIKTHPNPTGEPSTAYEWKQLHHQFACLYGLLVNKGHVNALSRSINYLFGLLTED